MKTKLDEEEKGLLRKILRAQAYRQMMSANMRGHGLKYLFDSQGRLGLVQDIQHVLNQVNRVQELYTSIGGGDIRHEASVRMERIPYPTTRFDLATFLATSGPAESLAMETYTNSKWEEFAQVARDDLAYEREATKRGTNFFHEFAADKSQRPLVRQVLHRWMAICLLSLGRPGSAGDRRALELGLRDSSVSDSSKAYLEMLAPMMKLAGLSKEKLREAGVQLPE